MGRAHLVGAMIRQPEQLRGPVARVWHAPGAMVQVRDTLDIGIGARVEQMEDWQCRPAVRPDSEEAVPECAAPYSRDFVSSTMNLSMKFVEAIKR
jgi:hypothetical protein